MFKAARSLMGKSSGAAAASAKSSANDDAASLESRIAKLQTSSRKAAAPLPAKTIETRGADRFVPLKRQTFLTAKSGKKFDARIINISTLGVALEANFPSGEDIVQVGSRRVQPGRRMMRGMVFLFETPLEAKYCGPSLVL